MNKYLLLSIAAFALLSLDGPTVTPASAAKAKPANIAKKIKRQQHKIQRVQKGIEEHKELVRSSKVKETSLFDQLEEIDRSIKEGKIKLAKFKNKIALHEKLIKQKSTEVAQRNLEKDAVKEHVQKRLAAFYRMGDIGVMNVTFSAANLPELLNFNEYFKALVKYDRKEINNYRLKIETLTDIKNILEEEQRELLDVITTIRHQENKLETVRQERVLLLARVDTEKKLYQRAIEEMEAASTRLTETLAELREKLVSSQKSQKRFYSSPKKRRPGSYRGFPTMKGRLIPPVRGSVTSFFGKTKQGKFGITTFADGINIKTVAGKEIKAIYNGKVVFAGPLKGYGNLIIIDHDHQYYSLTSRAAELYKEEGDIVSTGEVIGIMTESGGLLGEGLHFEIRHGTEPLNPLHWVKKSLLTINSTHAAIQPGKKKPRNN
ncbi:MAG: peptidoglycan DD-metalloendopeptidase family protein [Thermodesulfobacteriota bacterium]